MTANESARSTRDGPPRPSPRLRQRMRTNSAGVGRMLLVRRAAAVLLVLLAAALAARAPTSHASEKVRILVASHDLAPGVVLTGQDVTAREVPTDLVPDGALRDPSAIEGRALNDPSRRGEPLTDVHLEEPGTMPVTDDEHATDDDQAVPVRLADPAVADFLRPGQRVDLVATSARSDSEPPEVVAERVPVIALRPSGGDDEGRGRLIVVGLPDGQAATVAAASLTEPLAVTLR